MCFLPTPSSKLTKLLFYSSPFPPHLTTSFNSSLTALCYNAPCSTSTDNSPPTPHHASLSTSRPSSTSCSISIYQAPPCFVTLLLQSITESSMVQSYVYTPSQSFPASNPNPCSTTATSSASNASFFPILSLTDQVNHLHPRMRSSLTPPAHHVLEVFYFNACSQSSF